MWERGARRSGRRLDQAQHLAAHEVQVVQFARLVLAEAHDALRRLGQLLVEGDLRAVVAHRAALQVGVAVHDERGDRAALVLHVDHLVVHHVVVAVIDASPVGTSL